MLLTQARGGAAKSGQTVFSFSVPVPQTVDGRLLDTPRDNSHSKVLRA